MEGNRNPKESHWVPALRTHPITPVCPVPSVPPISPRASASSPYLDQVGASEVSSGLQFTCREPNSPSETGVWHPSLSPCRGTVTAAPNPSSESKSLTDMAQTLLPGPGPHDPSISLLKTVWETLQVQNTLCGFLPPSPLLKGTTWILGDPKQMLLPSRCLP